MYKMIQCVVFDLDDTLYLERDYALSGFKAVNHYLQKLGVEGFLEPAWSLFQAGKRKNIFNAALDSINAPYDESLISTLVWVYRNHIPDIALLPDAKKALSQLTGTYRLGLITDGFSVSQKSKISSLGLDKVIGHIVVTDDLGSNREYWKPHIKAFLEISDFFSVPHSCCAYIGDNPIKDFLGANKLGWLTVQVKREGRVHDDIEVAPEFRADYEIASLDELGSLLIKVGEYRWDRI